MEERVFSEMIKENVVAREPLALRWLVALVALVAGALVVAARLDEALPEARAAAPGPAFSGRAAHQLLVNLTAGGPRVAGSYENEVVAVRSLVAALRAAAAGAGPHNRLELDRLQADGAFELAFFDGLNNVYRGVQAVLARVRAAGPAPRRQPALLLNCHFDSVPDSPGASDDGAGCAVALEAARALAAGRALRRPAVFLLNGAEENILQGAHAALRHPWLRAARAFLNLEACGAGGRELLFQAGPAAPWLLEAYARAAPRPYGSSLAQELFESGLLPGDTDFRIFRDFANLSGLDFAWNANGYVYHTALDTAARVPPAALQRTGDNVLALVHELLEGEDLGRGADGGLPVFFDVLGLRMVAARAPAAAAAAAATLALLLLNVHHHAHQARVSLFVSLGAWWRAAGAGAAAAAAGGVAGAGAAAAGGAALAAADAALAYYARPWLLAPLAALPAVGVSWAVVVRGARWAAPAGARGWWRARALRDGGALLGAGALLLAAAARLRSGYVPLLLALPPALADRAALLLRAGDRARALLWLLGAALPTLQCCALLLALLATVVPVAGRSGSPPIPIDVVVFALTGALALLATSALLPFVAATRRPHALIWGSLGVWAATLVLVGAGALYAPYSAERPQRVLVFPTWRTLHAAGGGGAVAEHGAWAPHLDPNSARALRRLAARLGAAARPMAEADCARWVYCGAPYYLPVLGLAARATWLRGPQPPPPAPPALLDLAYQLRELNASAAELHLNLTGPNHVVVIAAPVRGARVARLRTDAGALAPRRAAPWRAARRHTYFTTLHDARPDVRAHWHLTLLLLKDGTPEELAEPAADGARWVSLSVAAHAMAGAAAAGAGAAAGGGPWARAALAAAAPPHAALSGWPVHMHLLAV